MGKDTTVDQSEIKGALSSIGLSVILILGATFFSQGLGFITRITMARYLPIDGYGNVVLGISLLNLVGIAALAGLPQAISRYIPRKETQDERQIVISTSFQIVGTFSLVIALLILLLAEPIAKFVFNNSDLVWVFRIFAGILPFYALFKLSIGGFRGYEKTTPQVITDKALLPGLQLIGIAVFVTLGYNYAGIAFAYAVSFLLVSAVSIALIYRLGDFSVRTFFKINSGEQYRELLVFSIPLAASGAINTIAKHSDLVVLGIFLSSGPVGVYEISYRMALFVIFIFSPAVGYLLQPLLSRFDAAEDHKKMEQLYSVTTRWVVVASFPVFSLLLLFPEQTLSFFFREEYSRGALSLSILAVGFMASRLPGLTGTFLTATGKTKTILYISLATATINIGMNIILIPTLGIYGAAIATATAHIFNNTVQVYIMERKFGIHPFNRNYILPSIFMVGLFIGIYLSPIQLDRFTFQEGFVTAVGMGVAFLIFVLLTRSVYNVEAELAESLLHRVGISVPISRYLQPFIH